MDGNGTETGHIIVTTIGGRNGQPKQVIVHNVFLVQKRKLTEIVTFILNISLYIGLFI